LLVGAVVVSLVAWILEGRQGLPFEALVISAIVIANAVLGYAEEAKAEQAVAALQRMTATTAAVLRDGVQRRVPAEEIVPGDDLLVLATATPSPRLLGCCLPQTSKRPRPRSRARARRC
jgi:P-type Ca2+ transporter type 2C